MNRFFAEKQQITDKAELTGEDFVHLTRVLRLKTGDEIMLCDGEGTEYTARISALTKTAATVDIIENHPSETEPVTDITLFQGLPKAGKLETIIQKCVEIGVRRIVPVAMVRSVVKISGKDFSARLTRFNRVAYEAAKQSRRGCVPEVANIITLEGIDFSSYDTVIVAYEDEHQTSLKEALRSAGTPGSIALIIGPEGGFDASEIAFLRDRGAVCVSLGRRILRTETAGMAALAMILFSQEDCL